MLHLEPEILNIASSAHMMRVNKGCGLISLISWTLALHLFYFKCQVTIISRIFFHLDAFEAPFNRPHIC